MPDCIERRVRTAIGRVVGIEAANIRPDSILIEHLGADTLDRIQLALNLEEDFGISIGGAEADWQTAGDVLATVEQLVGRAAERVRAA
jgi:acyl carrier protein